MRIPAFFSSPWKAVMLPFVFAYFDALVLVFHPEVFADPLRWIPLAAMNLLSGADIAIRKVSDSERHANRAAAIALFIIFPALVVMPHFEREILEIESHNAVSFAAFLALEIAGGAILIVSRATIGRFGSTDIAIEKGHRLVTRGIYSRVRNPMYLGILIMYPAYCMASGGFLSAVAIAALLLPVLLRRTALKETILEKEFGAEYRDYTKRTGRFIPRLSGQRRICP